MSPCTTSQGTQRSTIWAPKSGGLACAGGGGPNAALLAMDVDMRRYARDLGSVQSQKREAQWHAPSFGHEDSMAAKLLAARPSHSESPSM